MKLPGLPWPTLSAGGLILAAVLVGVFLGIHFAGCGAMVALLCVASAAYLVLRGAGNRH
jgi:hypothetical protein